MKLGFVGCGKMATALVEGVLKAGAFQREEIFVTDSVPEAVRRLEEKCGVRGVAGNAELAARADGILLCVKPKDASDVLGEIGESARGKLLISIMAGVTISALEKMAKGAQRIARVMPNTPALIHRGAAAYALGPGGSDEDAAVVERIFSAVGQIFRVEESLLDAVTGLSGSGPAYIYVAIEALADAGVAMGLPAELSLQLAAQTVAGAAEMVLQTGMHPAELAEMVKSPGGTTIAGIAALEEGGFRAAISDAVRAATNRSREMGEKK